MKRNNAGFTLIEVLIAIVVLGLIVMPICSSLVMAVRMNAKAESILEAKLAVSSAVEELMAEGYPTDIEVPEGMTIAQSKENESDPYYKITVTYMDISVTTHVRDTGGDG